MSTLKRMMWAFGVIVTVLVFLAITSPYDSTLVETVVVVTTTEPTVSAPISATPAAVVADVDVGTPNTSLLFVPQIVDGLAVVLADGEILPVRYYESLVINTGIHSIDSGDVYVLAGENGEISEQFYAEAVVVRIDGKALLKVQKREDQYVLGVSSPVDHYAFEAAELPVDGWVESVKMSMSASGQYLLISLGSNTQTHFFFFDVVGNKLTHQWKSNLGDFGWVNSHDVIYAEQIDQSVVNVQMSADGTKTMDHLYEDWAFDPTHKTMLKGLRGENEPIRCFPFMDSCMTFQAHDYLQLGYQQRPGYQKFYAIDIFSGLLNVTYASRNGDEPYWFEPIVQIPVNVVDNTAQAWIMDGNSKLLVVGYRDTMDLRTGGVSWYVVDVQEKAYSKLSSDALDYWKRMIIPD